MAQPAPIYDRDKKKAVTRPDLQALEDGGKTSPPTSDSSATPEPADAGPKEAAPQRSYYKGPGQQTLTSLGLSRFSLRGRLTKRRAIFGSGIIGTIIAIFGFTLLSGPLQFIHFAKLMEQFHFSAQQDQQDSRFLKQVRFARYAANGEVEKARLGYLGNKLTNTFETKLNASGYESAYSPKFGLFDGYVIDTGNQKFKGKSIGEIKSIVKAETGLDVVDGGTVRSNLNGKLVIDARKVGFSQTHSLTRNILGQAGYSKLSAAIGSRLMCARADCTLHPLKKLSVNVKGALENWWASRNQNIEKGASPNLIAKTDTSKASDPKTAEANAAAAKNEGDITLSEAQKAAAKASTGDQSGVAAQKASLARRVGLGGASVVGIACMAKGVADNADNIKQTQVVLPLIRQSTEFIALGSQIQSGQEVDLNELAKYSQLLNGTDASGKKSSWIQARSIQAELGHPNKGTPASDTLKTISKGSPFDFLKEGNVGAVMGTACNSFVSGALTVVSFLGAGVSDLVVLGIQQAFAPAVLDAAAQWFAGQAVSPTPVGADAGNQINYGSHLAANDQAIAAAGTALSSEQASELKSIESIAYDQDFKKQGLVQRLLNPYDGRSAISKLIDQSSPSFGQNLAKMGSMFLNVGQSLASLGHIFTKPALAANSAAYDYGVPQFGFSAKDMDDPLFANPYENACYVVGCPAKGISGFLENQDTASKYKTLVKQCFGINLEQAAVSGQTDQQWGVTSEAGDSPTYNSIPPDCSSADTNWRRLRFFIMDTETMNSMACYENDDQACQDIGFGNSASSPAPSSSPTATNNYQNPFRDIPNLVIGRIDQGVDYGGSGKVYAIGNGKVNTVTTMADWPGGVFINYTLTDGPAAGKNVFVAEHCTPVPGLGTTITTVTSSTVLCNMTGGANAIETGWAADPSSGYIAMAYDVYRGKTDGDPTAFGQNFSDFLKSIGAPPGDISQSSSRTLLGNLPNGWPTW